MEDDDPLKEYNRYLSGLSVEEIRNMTDEEILECAIERPDHPGQYGFLLRPEYFRSQDHAAETLQALLERLGKAKKRAKAGHVVGGEAATVSTAKI